MRYCWLPGWSSPGPLLAHALCDRRRDRPPPAFSCGGHRNRDVDPYSQEEIMKRLALIALSVLVHTALASSPGLCSLSLNEIMADPASDWNGDGEYTYQGDEWVEVVNSGPATVDLSGYLLGDDNGLLTFGLAGSLQPGETVVVYGSESKEWQSANGLPSLGFSMSNDGDTVVLFHVDGGDTLMVDSHVFNTYEADDDRSTGRNPDGTGGWEIFDALNPYGGDTPPAGNGLPPTPGSSNTGPVAVDHSTWGAVKAIYRPAEEL
ncbi:MAG: hypothetical protein GF355_04295 [Candidatus Eisenbacteria bacterium]|nr:hypothetical protein [Candidatus Eisenbacteria bacterium]